MQIAFTMQINLSKAELKFPFCQRYSERTVKIRDGYFYSDVLTLCDIQMQFIEFEHKF